MITAMTSFGHSIPVDEGDVLIARSSHEGANYGVQVVRRDNTFLVSSSENSVTFNQYGITTQGLSGDVFTIREFSPKAFSVIIKNLRAGDTVAFFSNDRMQIAYPKPG